MGTLGHGGGPALRKGEPIQAMIDHDCIARGEFPPQQAVRKRILDFPLNGPT